jgi:hypothetical protein
MEFSFARGALQGKQQSVVEKRRLIDANGIADQRIGEPKSDEPVPVGIVGGLSGHFQTEDKADLTERDLRGQPANSGNRDGSGPGHAEILVKQRRQF